MVPDAQPKQQSFATNNIVQTVLYEKCNIFITLNIQTIILFPYYYLVKPIKPRYSSLF